MIATTIEQSKRLVELGLDPATSDMCYPRDAFSSTYDLEPACHGAGGTGIALPAWSFDALAKIISDAYILELHIRTDKTWNLYCKYSAKVIFRSFDINNGEGYKSPIDAIYHLLVWLLENGKMNPKK